jgi:hypothetical protein
VFLVSANGQETIYQFTKTILLPSNNINDIEIDSISGEVLPQIEDWLVLEEQQLHQVIL